MSPSGLVVDTLETRMGRCRIAKLSSANPAQSSRVRIQTRNATNYTHEPYSVLFGNKPRPRFTTAACSATPHARPSRVIYFRTLLENLCTKQFEKSGGCPRDQYGHYAAAPADPSNELSRPELNYIARTPPGEWTIISFNSAR